MAKQLIYIRAYFLIGMLTITFIILSYNLYRFYNQDYKDNKDSMRLFYVTEASI